MADAPDPGLDAPPPEAVAAAAAKLRDLRERLVDLTGRNPFLNFRHRANAKAQLRLVDELPDQLYRRLIEDKSAFRLASLPEPPDEPDDERSPAFRNALAAAAETDEAYLAEVEALDADDPNDPRLWAAERALKDRVRLHLGMAPWVHGREMTPAEWARQNGVSPAYDLPEAGDFAAADKHRDAALQTLLFRDDLARRGRGLMAEGRRWREEKGVDALFLALGFLEWRDGPADAPARLAPLILVPVEITTRPTASGPRFDVALGPGGPRGNLALGLKLAQDFGLALPEFEAFGATDAGDDGDEAATPEAFFRAVAEMAAKRSGWRVRRQATFAPFTFGALAIHADLDPTNWAAPLAEAPLLASLLGGWPRGGGGVDAPAGDFVEDATPTPAPLVLDADASQYAIVHAAALAGQDIAVQGPPGTGKSQTIVNLIAAALGAGKRVLFVAEKAAALDVVAKRLTDVGLGDFCLELHGAHGRREDVLAALKRRIEMAAPVAGRRKLEQALAEAQDLKQSLAGYAAAINQPFGALGLTVHELIWREQATRRHDLPAAVDEAVIADAAGITPYRADAARGLLDRVSTADADFRAAYGAPERHPWRAAANGVPAGAARDRALAALGDWAGTLADLAGTLPAWRAAGLEPPAPLGALADAATAIVDLPTPPEDVARDVLAGLGTEAGRQALADYLQAADARLEAEAALEAAFEDPDAARRADGLPAFAAALQTVLGDAPARDLSAIAAARAERAEVWRTIAGLARDFIEAVGAAPASGRATVGALKRALDVARTLREMAPEAGPHRRRIAADAELSRLAVTAADQIERLGALRDALRQEYGIDLERLGDLPAIENDAAAIRAAGLFAGLFDGAYKAAVQRLRDAGATAKDKPARLAALAAAQRCRRAEADALADPAFKARLGAAFDGLATDAAGLRAAAAFGDAVRARFPGLEGGALRQAIFAADDARFAEMRQAAEGDAVGTLAEAAAELDGSPPDAPLADLPEAAAENARHAEGLARRIADLGVRPEAHAADVVRAAEAQQAHVDAERVMGGQAAFGGLNPALSALRATAAYGDALAEAMASAPGLLEAVVDAAATGALDPLRRAAAETMTAGAAERTARVAAGAAGFDADRIGQGRAGDLSVEALARAAEAALVSGEDGLAGWSAYRADIVEAEDAGHASLLDAFRATDAPLDGLALAFDRALYRTLVREAVAASPVLQRWRGARAEDLRRRYRSIDREIMGLQAEAIRSRLAARRGPAGNRTGRVGTFTERSLIEHYAQQKRPRVTLRRLFAGAPGAIQALKPCLMLSPTTVAEALTPETMRFDLVVIDEASQMKPEFAVGALARAGQAVIVGDEMQLPPTDFFNRNVDLDDDDEAAEDRVQHESILALARTAFRPERPLLWHYRSRHENLIAFSNQQFYEDRLVVFPAAMPATPGRLGVSLRPVEDARYTAGRRVNPVEAEAVVEAALTRMRTTPERSLGVVAMNIAQRDLIEDMFARTAAGDPDAEAYLERWRAGGLEPFFVKNLENVQGDERDVILISATYGPDSKTGTVMQRFGPINGAHGHRRLNVLFTRARFETQIFASLNAADVRAGPDAARGLHAFRDYLGYAATGRLPAAAVAPSAAFESAFEAEVARLLRDRGFDVTPQVGVAGYRIDLGVTHPSFPHGFIAGVECDGARYHAAASARDRDRLRQEALEGLGWTILRVWSTDWFADPKGEAHKLAQALEKIAERATPLLV